MNDRRVLKVVKMLSASAMTGTGTRPMNATGLLVPWMARWSWSVTIRSMRSLVYLAPDPTAG